MSYLFAMLAGIAVGVLWAYTIPVKIRMGKVDIRVVDRLTNLAALMLACALGWFVTQSFWGGILGMLAHTTGCTVIVIVSTNGQVREEKQAAQHK
jgi:hypothetical protein